MKKKILLILLIIVAAFCSWYFIFSEDETAEEQPTYVEITRGDLNTTISSTGTLKSVSEIEVGTQVSGRIDKIFVDFNDYIKKGQLLALIDTTSLSASVRDAKATLLKTKAQLEEAKIQYEVNKGLFDKNMISEIDYVTSKTSYDVAAANNLSAVSALEKAETNLVYAFIKSPINGIVIARNIEEGQTVAASFEAPVLFTIAEDLSQMEILAAVDESDIGQIKEGQTVKFTVQAYPDSEFEGKTKQIRLQPETVSNVVNYTVVLSAPNEKNLLLPGMTATIDFYIDERTDALLIPNTAFKYTPTEKMMLEFDEQMRKNMPSPGQDSSASRPPSPNGMPPKDLSSFKQIWYYDDDNNLRMEFVEPGITDGVHTEILNSDRFKKGMKVLAGSSSSKTTTQSQSQRMGPPPPMF